MLRQTPQIVHKEGQSFIGYNTQTSFAHNRTFQLWNRFMPKRSSIKTAIGIELYSIDVYPPGFYTRFNPEVEFIKWAAVKVAPQSEIPDGFELLEVAEGVFAVFSFKGKPSESRPFFEWVFQEWIPNSAYELDERPHIAVMGERYLGEDPASEEEIWIPLKN